MNGQAAVFAAGLLILVLAGVIDVIAGARSQRLRALPYLLGAAASACLAATGAFALAGSPVGLGVTSLLGRSFAVSGSYLELAPSGQNVTAAVAWQGWPSGTGGLRADRLSGLFLLIAFCAAVAISLACASWAARPDAVGRRGLGASYALTLAAVAVVLTATDAFTLLFGWELVTLGFYLLAGFERGKPGRPAGALVTLVFGRLSGVALLVGLLLLAVRSGSLNLASFAHVPHSAVRDVAQVLLILGFTIKVGLIPFQIWLPRGYAAAAGPVRAIMAGVAANIGFYGLWRTLAVLGPPPAWVTGLLLVLGGLTALLGIAHAAVQPGLQRVIAYSSVENAGLIVVGYGIALTGAAVHNTQLVAVGLLAATLQIITHTAAKSLLFTSSAIIAPRGHGSREAPGDDDLDDLRGVARRLPWSGTGLAIGSLTLAGLPLTIGFASEWFLLEALMQQFRVPGLGFRLVLATAGALVALTAGFAGVTFVRLTGLVVLGRDATADGAGPGETAWPADSAGPSEAPGPATAPWAAGSAAPASTPRSGQDRDYGPLGRVGVVLLAAACLVTAMLLPLVIRMISAGLSPVVPAVITAGARKSPWVVQPVFAGFSILSPSWLWLVMPLLALAVLGFARLVSGTRLTQVRRVPSWQSATAGVQGPASYTASGFANPTRRILAAVLHTRSELGPAGGQPAGSPLRYTVDVLEVVEAYVYRPAMRPVAALVRVAKRIQSGRLEAYLGYLLIALIALIAVVTALA